jgi:hypothetical protein
MAAESWARLMLQPSSSRFLAFSANPFVNSSVETINNHGNLVTCIDATSMPNERGHDSFLPRAKIKASTRPRDYTDFVEKEEFI